MPQRDVHDLIRGFRRDQVVTTALRMFGRSESLEVSMEEIAAEAGVSRSTIYNHFRDRAELLSACAEWSHARVASAMQKSLDSDGEPIDLLTGFFEAAFVCLDENPGFYRLATGLRVSTSAAEETLGIQLSRSESLGREQIDNLVDRLADADLATDRETTMSFVGVVMSGALQRRAVTSDPPPAHETARQLAELVLFGLVHR